MRKHCSICGQSFVTYPSKVASERGKYCSRLCSDKVTLIKKGEHRSPQTELKKGDKPWSYKGFRYHRARPNSPAYKEIYIPTHPYATKAGYVREHRLIMEKELGRYLEPSEVVHHINGDTLNNSPGNLRVMPKVEHDRINTPLNIHKRWQKGESRT